ncbi:ATPase, T2SS/T4P/T4SS family [Bdellovibrio bacteriovorus]|uniref:ATPase, T2SS/T4P/T4SS family n=1 Tax=Bdellovibrio bacteriovorus TaxID=959 RepID=UPI0035A714DC
MSDQSNVFKQTIQQNLGPVSKYLDDKGVSEILINGHKEIFVERKGKLERVSESFPSEDDLRAAVNSIAQSVGRRIDDESPRLDARLPDGSRIAAVIPPMSRKGTTLSIRKFTNNKITFADYIRFGAITEDGARFWTSACSWEKTSLSAVVRVPVKQHCFHFCARAFRKVSA